MALTQTAVPTTPSEKATTKLPVPASTRPFRIAWFYAVGIIGCHLIALLAVLPWFYSRTGVILAILGLYVFGTLGINLCYHRLLTHRGLVCPKWLEHSSQSLEYAVCRTRLHGGSRLIGVTISTPMINLIRTVRG